MSEMQNMPVWLVVLAILKNISQWEELSHKLWKITMFETTNQQFIFRGHSQWIAGAKLRSLAGSMAWIRCRCWCPRHLVVMNPNWGWFMALGLTHRYHNPQSM
jgi:hypothetical protein